MSYDPTEVPQAPTAADGLEYTSIAVFNGGQWSLLCPEVDIASVGATLDEALARLEEAVRETLAYVEETGRSRATFARVPEEELREFLLSHEPGCWLVLRSSRL